MTRNDNVIVWHATEIMEQTRWHARGRQDAHMRVLRAVQRHLREFRQQTRIPDHRDGFLGYDLDPANSRLIMQIDPTVLDRGAFRRMVDAAAHKANRRAKVKGTPLTVTVQNGCFPAAEIARVLQILYRNPWVAYLNGGGEAGRPLVRRVLRRGEPRVRDEVAAALRPGPGGSRVRPRHAGNRPRRE